MRIEIRSDRVIIDGYVNAVGRDSRPIWDPETKSRFVEQIVPGAFKRALTQNEVMLLLDHDENRELGSTESNLTLTEDSIGLRAHAEVTDPEVIEKAKKKLLRGWSFGFYERGAAEEDLKNGMKRRYVEDMKLVEVSIIDEKKMPCYEGTSIETRAEKLVKTEVVEVRATYAEAEKAPVNYTSYKERIKKLEEKK